MLHVPRVYSVEFMTNICFIFLLQQSKHIQVLDHVMFLMKGLFLYMYFYLTMSRSTCAGHVFFYFICVSKGLYTICFHTSHNKNIRNNINLIKWSFINIWAQITENIKQRGRVKTILGEKMNENIHKQTNCLKTISRQNSRNLQVSYFYALFCKQKIESMLSFVCALYCIILCWCETKPCFEVLSLPNCLPCKLYVHVLLFYKRIYCTKHC